MILIQFLSVPEIIIFVSFQMWKLAMRMNLLLIFLEGMNCIMQPLMVSRELVEIICYILSNSFRFSGDDETVDAVIKSGANVNIEDTDGSTPLDYAAWNGHTSPLIFLSSMIIINRLFTFPRSRASCECAVQPWSKSWSRW